MGQDGPVEGTADETWTSHECAQAWGVKTPTWLGYVARGQAPAPLPGRDAQRRHRWDPEAVRSFPRPGAGRTRQGAAPAAVALLAEMEEVTGRIDALREQQRELARAGKAEGVEVRAMARALGVSPHTVYAWLDEDG
jgi:hypothetical protein